MTYHGRRSRGRGLTPTSCWQTRLQATLFTLHCVICWKNRIFLSCLVVFAPIFALALLGRSIWRCQILPDGFGCLVGELRQSTGSQRQAAQLRMHGACPDAAAHRGVSGARMRNMPCSNRSALPFQHPAVSEPSTTNCWSRTGFILACRSSINQIYFPRSSTPTVNLSAPRIASPGRLWTNIPDTVPAMKQ